jgi:energy-coupling factor transport system ATP-binding protein
MGSRVGVTAVDITTAGLSFTYPSGTRALDGVDLTIRQGELVAIIGQNGSGKSTLVRHFNGLLRATDGLVTVGREPVGRRHVAALARLVGIAFQNPDRQVFSSKVGTEVGFGARMLGVTGSELDDRVSSALDQLGLTAVRDVNPYDLGFSQRKLLALASVLAMRTPVVVLDEPTTGQDLRGVERVKAVVRSLAAAGRTVIAISHSMRFVADTFERVLVMRAGKIALDGSVDEAFAKPAWPTLESTYLEAPLAAVVGSEAGLPYPTPTEGAFVAALRDRQASANLRAT